MRKYIGFIIILACLPLLISCRQAAPLAPEEPVVTLLSPSNGEIVSSGDIQVRIYLQNFKMVPPNGQSNRANEGHAIYYLDTDIPLNAGTPATTEAGTYVISADTSNAWTNVSPGRHTFSIQLVNNDNTPLLAHAAVRATVTAK